MQVLILEDDPELLSALSKYFDEDEYRVISCSTYDKAVKSITQIHYDIVIADYKLTQLTEKTGYDFLKLFKEKSPHSVCILTSAYKPETIEHIDRHYVDYIIEKPFDFDVLGEKLSGLIHSTFGDSEHMNGKPECILHKQKITDMLERLEKVEEKERIMGAALERIESKLDDTHEVNKSIRDEIFGLGENEGIRSKVNGNRNTINYIKVLIGAQLASLLTIAGFLIKG